MVAVDRIMEDSEPRSEPESVATMVSINIESHIGQCSLDGSAGCDADAAHLAKSHIHDPFTHRIRFETLEVVEEEDEEEHSDLAGKTEGQSAAGKNGTSADMLGVSAGLRLSDFALNLVVPVGFEPRSTEVAGASRPGWRP